MATMTTQKNFRFNKILLERFEKYCADNLLDERSVVEACMLGFLEATDSHRQELAKKFTAWVATNSAPVKAGRRKKAE